VCKWVYIDQLVERYRSVGVNGWLVCEQGRGLGGGMLLIYMNGDVRQIDTHRLQGYSYTITRWDGEVYGRVFTSHTDSITHT